MMTDQEFCVIIRLLSESEYIYNQLQPLIRRTKREGEAKTNMVTDYISDQNRIEIKY